MIRRITERQFAHFLYFYRLLGRRLLAVPALGAIAGIMDGLGLAMFIPLMAFASQGGGTVDHAALGNLRFLTESLTAVGITPTLTVVLLMMLGFFVFKGLVAFLAQYQKVHYAQHFISTVRESTIIALAEYQYARYALADVGRIQNTLTTEIGRVSHAMTTYLGVINSVVLISVYATLAFIANAQFAVLVIIGGLLTNLGYRAIYRRTEQLSREISRQGHKLQRLVIQQSAYFKYLKATGISQMYADKLVQEVKRMEDTNRQIGVLSAVTGGVREPIMILVIVAVILVQVNLMGESLALMLLSIMFFYRALGHLLTLQGQWNAFLGKSGSIANLKEFTDELRRHKDQVGTYRFQHLTHGLELRAVSFGYRTGATVLSNVSLTIRRNETFALVGESGSGKTTVMNILAGLLVPTEGTCLVDGRPMTEIDVSSYQRRIGYITQEPVIFDDSVFQNVTLWDTDTPETRERAVRALQQAHFANFVETLPRGMDSRLGIGGINLSGGQRQRIAIARELYKGIDILLMDEATASLDTESENQLKENIEALKGRLTIVIIAHRLSTIRHADRVALVRAGTIASIGTYEDLCEQAPGFRRMVELQTI
ncbi:MAG: hypothetical protein RLZZ63_340 [Gemmatimonadota bacterium]|jgi:subfamily B ATP-binding cassette protein MsbA